MKTTNPATGELIKEYANTSFEEFEGIVFKANKAQEQWSNLNYPIRAPYLRKIADILEQQKNELSELMAQEMGKPIAQGVGEVEKCAWVCRFYAEKASKFLDRKFIKTEANRSYVSFEPLGTVLSIMPWNFPFWQLFRFGAPALMAGNAVILKHAEVTTGCALKIEEIIHDSGIPSDLFRTILIENDDMKPVIQHEGIAAVTLTGSTKAGKIVASQAGEALKKTVLELGGSDPYLILEDADIQKAAETCATSRLINSGQSCIAAKRFIVTEKVYDEFLEAFRFELEKRTVGDPFEEGTDVGPMARKDLRDTLHDQVIKSIELGAKPLIGCKKTKGDGAYYPVSILTDVTKGMPAYDEELFGPVASIIKVKNTKEAIQVANDTQYGLGAAVFSSHREKAEQIAVNQLKAGCVFVNEYVKSDPRLPFGGIKNSGYGRELGRYGIREFVNTKTVWVE
ncbi:MAG: NAD-dependent succinate-semialdehyde dehydrogenase [Balneolaceae bacterium]|nr:NAD-dependent succinate-semialdehyde dehydrogenase [Balneolaceae bacterium]MBO6546647.1 NAD-dependent succinate-semialdehyde dehydrogenase [Balneolaceae bacterium]MBO6649005.1 NAD-dependent succinate-semialdehyde dehydrogenase [Balneolaceae bacterium]